MCPPSVSTDLGYVKVFFLCYSRLDTQRPGLTHTEAAMIAARNTEIFIVVIIAESVGCVGEVWYHGSTVQMFPWRDDGSPFLRSVFEGVSPVSVTACMSLPPVQISRDGRSTSDVIACKRRRGRSEPSCRSGLPAVWTRPTRRRAAASSCSSTNTHTPRHLTTAGRRLFKSFWGFRGERGV